MLPRRKMKRIGRKAASFNALNVTIRGFDLQSDRAEKSGDQLAVVTGRGGQVMIGRRVEDQDLDQVFAGLDLRGEIYTPQRGNTDPGALTIKRTSAAKRSHRRATVPLRDLSRRRTCLSDQRGRTDMNR
jgi:hypothetical protein